MMFHFAISKGINVCRVILALIRPFLNKYIYVCVRSYEMGGYIVSMCFIGDSVWMANVIYCVLSNDWWIVKYARKNTHPNIRKPFWGGQMDDGYVQFHHIWLTTICLKLKMREAKVWGILTFTLVIFTSTYIEDEINK